jgi:hypothetical protein
VSVSRDMEPVITIRCISVPLVRSHYEAFPCSQIEECNVESNGNTIMKLYQLRLQDKTGTFRALYRYLPAPTILLTGSPAEIWTPFPREFKSTVNINAAGLPVEIQTKYSLNLSHIR